MQAIVYREIGAIDVLELQDVPMPKPAAGELLVRVCASTIDASVLTRFPGGMAPQDPKTIFMLKHVMHVEGSIPGGEISGVVVAVGEGVVGFCPGDEVVADTNLSGGWAEYAVVKADQAAFKPKNLSFTAAACLPVAGIVSYGALKRAHVPAGGSVLVWGASGGVGTLCSQLAYAMGRNVTGAVRVGRITELSRRLSGAMVESDPTKLISGQCTFDAVLGVNGRLSFKEAKALLNPGGTYVAVGGEGAAAGILGPLLSFGSGKHLTFVTHDALVKTDALTQAVRLAECAQIEPLVSRTFALEDAAQAVTWTLEAHPSARTVLTVA